MSEPVQKVVHNLSTGETTYHPLTEEEALEMHRSHANPFPNMHEQTIKDRRRDFRLVTHGMSEEQKNAMRRLVGAPFEDASPE